MKIDIIAVATDARGNGTGRRLMTALEAEAMRRGVGRVYLGGANESNRGFYWRLGYSGRRSLMQKSLPRSRSGGQ
jgi:ribosomal protein S18 acetylase RimI-like enzyme